MLGMLEDSGYEKGGFGAASTLHHVAEVMRRYYADRSEYLADPDFYKVPLSNLLDKKYLAAKSSTINPAKASTSESIAPGVDPGYESMVTTHFSVVAQENGRAACREREGK